MAGALLDQILKNTERERERERERESMFQYMQLNALNQAAFI